MKSGRISAVHQDTKNKHRYHLYVDDEFAFSVHEDILVKYNLLKGAELDEAFCREILLAEEAHKAYLLALRYLGIRPRTAQQAIKYLQEKGFSPELAQDICERCKQQGYINDEAFSKQWVQERLRLKPRSSYVLRMELKQLGVAGEIVDEAVGSISREQELEAARKLVAKRFRNSDGPPDSETERKLMAMLMRKGFSSSIIQGLRREWREGGLG
ncbi:RecX family transcriptional regulator [Brevibacillus sp. H7]|uniref:RecX family transcriptional regulator n=1 Tax=Brevibacillus sp. H7 TaxID=3349138 RepID=UPI003809865A